MKHPLVFALAAGALIVLSALVPPLWHLLGGSPATADGHRSGLPWEAEVQADGTLEVFGLRLGRDTLADAEARLGSGLQVAIVARLDESGVLEALADPFAAGFVSGRLVLAFDAPAPLLQRWRERAPRSDSMHGGVRRYALHAEDLDEARRARISGLSFVPAAHLADADIRQRFGEPASVSAHGPNASTLHYPQLGLAATVGAAGRGVLQYVAPREFDTRLHSPAAGPAASR